MLENYFCTYIVKGYRVIFILDLLFVSAYIFESIYQVLLNNNDNNLTNEQ